MSFENKTKELKLLFICGLAPKTFQMIYDFFNYFWEIIFPKNRDSWTWKIRYRLNPRQKWIKKHIEYYRWCDKVELIPDFLFGCVINFIEEEKCFDFVEYGSVPEHREFAEKLKECYNYIAKERPILDNQIDAESTLAFHKAGSHKGRYGKLNLLEQKKKELDKKYLLWIVDNKDYLWV